jgi:hypothetical protein
MKGPKDHLEINLSAIVIFRRGDFDDYYSSRFYTEENFTKQQSYSTVRFFNHVILLQYVVGTRN